ncbi:MAG: hypothetical protein RLZZ08_500, partial [Pseudomonadota bacterium]
MQMPGVKESTGIEERMMFSKSTRIGLAAALTVGAAALVAPAAAHHSTAMFTWGESSEMKGVTVERWVWTNPHTFLYVRDAKGNRYALEGMSPSHLSRAGWSKRSLETGEKIDLTYYKLRDGRPGGFNVTVTLPDGSKLQQLPVRQ